MGEQILSRASRPRRAQKKPTPKTQQLIDKRQYLRSNTRPKSDLIEIDDDENDDAKIVEDKEESVLLVTVAATNQENLVRTDEHAEEKRKLRSAVNVTSSVASMELNDVMQVIVERAVKMSECA